MATIAEASFGITAVDRASATVQRINAAVSRLSTVGTMAGRAAKGLAIAGGLAATAASAAAVGLFRMAQGSAEGLDGLAKAAQKAGVTAEELAELRYSADLAGVGAEQLDGALGKLNKGIAEAAAGKNQDLVGLFHALGIKLRDSNGQLRSSADLLPQLAEAFKQNENPALRMRMVTALLGEAGAALVPWLVAGADAMREQREEAVALGRPTNAAAKAAEDFGDAQTRVNYALNGLKDTISGELFPILTPLLGQLTEWIKVNRTLIVPKVAEFVRNLGEAIKGINWSAVGAGALALSGALVTIANNLDVLTYAFAGFAALAIVGKVAALATAFKALGVAGLAASAPFWAVLAVIAALGAAIYVIMDKFGSFQTFWWVLTTGIEQQWTKAVDGITSTIDQLLAAFKPVTAAIDRIGKGIGAVGRFIGIGTPEAQRSIAAASAIGVGAEMGGYAGPGLMQAAEPSRGELVVRFENAPPGMRTEQSASGMDLTTETSVGRFTGGTGTR